MNDVNQDRPGLHNVPIPERPDPRFVPPAIKENWPQQIPEFDKPDITVTYNVKMKRYRDLNWFERRSSTTLWFIPYITGVIYAVLVYEMHPTQLENWAIFLVMLFVSSLIFNYFLKKWYVQIMIMKERQTKPDDIPPAIKG